MEIKKDEDRAYAEDDRGNVIAEASLRRVDGRLLLEHTYVDPALRGQGVAGLLMRAAAEIAREQNCELVPVCSYAAEWFARHPNTTEK